MSRSETSLLRCKIERQGRWEGEILYILSLFCGPSRSVYQLLASGARLCSGPKRAINEPLMEEAVPVKYEDTHKRIGVK